MCKMCDEGRPQDHSVSRGSRRDFLKASAATGAAAAGLSLFSDRPAAAQNDDHGFRDYGRPGRRYVIRGGHVMSMDPQVGDFAEADVLVEGGNRRRRTQPPRLRRRSDRRARAHRYARIR